MILTDDISVDDLLMKVQNIGDQLKDYTEKLVFSYADIAMYKKVKHNLEAMVFPIMNGMLSGWKNLQKNFLL